MELKKNLETFILRACLDDRIRKKGWKKKYIYIVTQTFQGYVDETQAFN